MGEMSASVFKAHDPTCYIPFGADEAAARAGTVRFDTFSWPVCRGGAS